MDLKLLITDDETMDREGLARQLDWKEYSICEVFTAKDGLSALEILKNNDIDILLSDIKMPLMSGIELAKNAREIKPELQIVFVSGYDDFMLAKMAIQVSVYEYILKPVCTDELSACIKNLVDKVRAQRAILSKNKQDVQSVKESKDASEENSPVQKLHNLKTTTEIDYLERQRKSRSGSIVGEVISYVESNYKNNINLDKIARIMYYTPNYLGKIFKEETELYFSEYLMEYRMRQAAILLRDRNIKILEVSMSVGYKSIPTFIKNFKSVYGVTPSEYKKYL